VGDFSLDARLDRTDAAVGDSVAFTVTLTGDGLLDGLSAAPLPDLRGARVYDGETMVRASLGEDGFRSVARVTRSLVPTEPGSLVLPPITWTVFSPEAGDYVVLRAEVPPLRVRGAAEAAEVQSFLGAAEPTPEPVDPIPPPRGERFRLHLSGTWLPAVALFGLLPGLGRGGRALLRWSSRPRAPREVAPATARDLLDAVAGAPDRLAALDAALRAREAQGGDATVADARVALDRARYADGADPEALVRRAILGGA
jgi:hypothetical protein